MVNQIVCPNCKRIIPNNAIIDDAVKGTGSGSQSMKCECGERITYWNIKAQLRDHKTIGWRFQNWVRSFGHSQG